MVSQQAQPLELKAHRLEIEIRWLVVGLVVILVALLATGGYLIATRVSNANWADKTTAHIAAINGTDLDTYLAQYATDAQFVTPSGSGQGTAALTDAFNALRTDGTVLTPVGDVVSAGQTTTTNFTWTNSLRATGTGVEVLVFNDAGLILYEAAFIQ